MKLPLFVIPVLIIAASLSAIPLKELFNAPSAELKSEGATEVRAADKKRATMIIEGVKCKGTANYLIARLNQLPGILEVLAYAGDRKVEVTYDKTKVSLEAIKQAAEAPIVGRDGTERKFFKILSVSEK